MRGRDESLVGEWKWSCMGLWWVTEGMMMLIGGHGCASEAGAGGGGWGWGWSGCPTVQVCRLFWPADPTRPDPTGSDTTRCPLDAPPATCTARPAHLPPCPPSSPSLQPTAPHLSPVVNLHPSFPSTLGLPLAGRDGWLSPVSFPPSPFPWLPLFPFIPSFPLSLPSFLPSSLSSHP
jgi:hypothetical protein